MYKKFSLWCDFIERDFIENEFARLIDSGIVNADTSNPAIFKESILNSPAYKEQLSKLKGRDKKEIYETLAITDIRNAAKKLLKNYEKGDDGFISIEVDPRLCDDEVLTIDEGVRLFKSINMPNVMIKIPATKAGYGAMRELLSRGININATLIFSPTQTTKCLEVIKDGMDSCKQESLPHAVISIFVSRFDRAADEKLDDKFRLGILNATKCYHLIENAAVKNTRALFASTGTKSDKLPKDYYIKELMYKNSINTAPLEAIKSFIKNNNKIKEPLCMEEVEKELSMIQKKINLDKLYEKLLNDGLEQFKKAFDEILKSI